MGKRYFKFQYFRGSLDNSELLCEQGIFYVSKLKIWIEDKLKLVRSVINHCIDDGFVLVMLIEGKGDVEFLMLGVRDDAGGHGVLL
jgi:hypothetical protein